MAGGTWQWVCVTSILQTAGTCPGHTIHGGTQQQCSYLGCSQSCSGATAAGDIGKPLGAAVTRRRCHLPVGIPPGYRWMSHKLRAPLPQRLLGGKAWFRQRYLVNFDSSERKGRCLGNKSKVSNRDWALLSPQSLQE